jgi:hypothetical protein
MHNDLGARGAKEKDTKINILVREGGVQTIGK